MKKTAQSVDTLSIVRTLHIIAHQTDEIFDTLLRSEFSLTLARFRIMLPLIEVEAMTQAEIARFHFLTEASIARQVSFLLNEKYLQRLPDCNDGRKFILTLTQKTKTLLPTIKRRLSEETKLLYADISEAELRSLSTLLDKMRTLGSIHSSHGRGCQE